MAESLETYARYPFLSGARKFVESLGLTLGELVDHPVYSASVEAGRRRIIDALNNSKPGRETPEGIELEISILSYPIARIIANLTKSRLVLGRYAGWEAERAHSLFRIEDGGILGDVKKDLAFPVREAVIDLKDYLKLATGFAKIDPRFKLVNRIIKDGRVVLAGADELLLLREAVRLRVLAPVKVDGMPKKLEEIAGKIKSVESVDLKTTIGELEDGDLPPCIKHMLSLLEAGEVSHNTMFILGTYFINLGLPPDDVVELFRRFPGFSEEKTRYQLEYLAGEKGGTKYSCPTCSKVKSYGLCEWDCGVKHPLQYRRGG